MVTGEGKLSKQPYVLVFLRAALCSICLVTLLYSSTMNKGKSSESKKLRKQARLSSLDSDMRESEVTVTDTEQLGGR